MGLLLFDDVWGFCWSMQQQVDDGIPINLCLSRFSHWLKKLVQEKSISYNMAGAADSRRCSFVTWSGECRRREICQSVVFKLPSELFNLPHILCDKIEYTVGVSQENSQPVSTNGITF